MDEEDRQVTRDPRSLTIAVRLTRLGFFSDLRMSYQFATHNSTIGLFVPPSRRMSLTSRLFTDFTITTCLRLHECSGPTGITCNGSMSLSFLTTRARKAAEFFPSAAVQQSHFVS
jgi:hypothetical protein